MKQLSIALGLILLAFFHVSSQNVYYVSSGGNNNNRGTTPELPWKSILTLSPGKTYLLQRGDTFYFNINAIPNQNVAEKIIISAYGTGEKPVLSLYKKIKSISWQRQSGTIWKVDISDTGTYTGFPLIDNNIGFLLVNGQVFGRKLTSLSELTHPWDFYSDHHDLYVYSEINLAAADASVEFSCNYNAVNMSDNMEISGISIIGAGANGISVNNKENVVIRDVSVKQVGGSFLPGYASGTTRYGNGVEFWNGGKNCLVEGCIVSEVYDVAFTMQGSGSGTTFENIVIKNNTAFNNEQSFETWVSGWQPGFLNCTFINNTCSDAGFGWSHSVRPDTNVGVHLLTYSWQVKNADLTIAGNRFSRAKSGLYYWGIGEPAPLFSSRNNIITLDSNTYIRSQVDAFKVENSDEFVAATGFEQGSSFRKNTQSSNSPVHNPGPSSSGIPIYRINSGGLQVTASDFVYSTDNFYSQSPGDIYQTASPIYNTTDDVLYQSERNSSSLKFNYALPVDNGRYTVILHFAEIYHMAIGNRVFDVSLEGFKVLDDYDIYKKAGGYTATTESFEVVVADNILNVDFSSLESEGGRDRPKISAIEVISHQDKHALRALAGDDETLSWPINFLQLKGSGIDLKGTISTYKWIQGSGPNIAVFSSNTVADPMVSGLIPGSYVFILTVGDSEQLMSNSDEVIITVNPLSAIRTPIYRINCGGGELAHVTGIFSADIYFSPAPGDLYSTTSTIAGTSLDALYQTERSASTGTMAYSLPVPSGQYTVVLHFAEIYFNFKNNRVFDVSIENTKVLDDFDIVKKAGIFTATTETFVVNVGDEMLNIYFSSLPGDGGVNGPKVSAIEVFRESGTQAIVTTNVLHESSGSGKLTKLTATLGPNPGNYHFNLLISGAKKRVDVKVLNAFGQEIEARLNLLGAQTLKLGSAYRPGLYYVLVQEGSERVILKFIKQNQ